MDLESLPFDQHGRYMSLAKVSQLYKKLAGKETLQVLDVGGSSPDRSGGHFVPAQQFLPHDKVYACDLPPLVLHRYVRASGTHLPFADHCFDIVFTTDVLEHVQPEGRNLFLTELSRVADTVIVSGPFKDDLVEDAENAVQTLARAIAGQSLQALDEHLECGLPDLEETCAILRHRGLSLGHKPHGRLDHWLAMYGAKLTLGPSDSKGTIHPALDRWYNRYSSPLAPEDSYYRRIIVAVRAEHEASLKSLLDAALEISHCTNNRTATSELAGFLRLIAPRLAERKNLYENLQASRLGFGQTLTTLLDSLDTISRESEPSANNEITAMPPYLPDGGTGSDDAYSAWLERSRPLLATRRRQLTKVLNSVADPPLISIVVPIFQPDLHLFQRCVDSVRSQVYQHWQLCLCDDGSGDPDLTRMLTKLAKRGSRIRVVRHEMNQGISAATNSALDLAEGEYIAFLDHDDELEPDTLAEVAIKLIENPSVDIIYTDEDKIDEHGRRYSPFFKPDWSPDYLLSVMYISHLSVIRRSLVEEIGRLRSEYDGSQDYDLILRATECSQSIVHIPKILYHWRTIEGSAARDEMAKPWAKVAAKRAVQEALDRRGEDAVTETGFFPWALRVRRRIRSDPLISVIIPFRDESEFLQRCIDSIRSFAGYDRWEALLVDNQSWEPETNALLNTLGNDPKCRVLSYSGEFNWSSINNWAVRHAEGDVLLFLNNDVEGQSEAWLAAMLEHAQRPEVGAVGARLIYPTGHVQHAGVIIGMGGVAGHAFKYCPPDQNGYFGMDKLIRNYSAVTGACMMVRRTVFEEVGGFDEQLRVAYNDIDFCLRIGAHGYSVVFTPYAELVHYESISRGLANDFPEIRKAIKRWLELLQKDDPYYNPNLSLRRHDFGFRYEDEIPPWKDFLSMLEG